MCAVSQSLVIRLQFFEALANIEIEQKGRAAGMINADAFPKSEAGK